VDGGIELNVSQRGCLDVVDWINPAQSMDRWRDLLNVIMKFRFQKNARIYLAS